MKPFNEDRISIVIKLSNEYPDISIFAVYDGHGGQGCAEFLRDNMPRFISLQTNLRTEPETSLKNAFKEAEYDFMSKNEITIKDRSGSCACLIMIMGD